MSQPIFQVDAFTSQPFHGNPAAVCPLPAAAEDSWMQNVAREMNLSETAFLVRQPDGQAEGYHLRWFTPAAEVRLCGHATLASAHILWETGMLGRHETARFHTLSGLLTADWRDGWIEMNFPATVAEEAVPPAGLLEAFGVKALYVGRSKFDYLIEVESEEIIRSLQPNFNALAAVEARGVMITSRSASAEYDFVSRFFAPAVGVNEDPVTGSSHCCLTPYWGQRLGKESLTAFQASPRGGELRLRLAGERVLLSGQAVTIMKGELQ